MLGLSRIGKNVDLLSMLPAELREVEGLNIYREHFVRDEELVAVLSGDDPVQVEEAARSLVEHLTARGEGIIGAARWQASGDNGAAVGTLADLAAYAWLNSDPDKVAALVDRIGGDDPQAYFAEQLDELTTTTDPQEVAFLQYDPSRLLEFPGSEGLLDGLGEQAAAFVSDNGLLRLVFLEHPTELDGYQGITEWMGQVEDLVGDWRESGGESVPGVKVSLTGEAAFQTETIDGMGSDLFSSVIGTSIAVALLFYFMNRRIRPLVWLLIALAIALVITLGFAAFTYGELSAVSAGFAAILIALVADYGVLVWQEGKTSGKTGRDLLKEVGPSIFWAGATTAAVFFGLNLSSFPGIAQLGNLVGAGILTGAVVIVFFYQPIASRLLEAKPEKPIDVPQGRIQVKGRSRLVIGGLLVVSVVVFLTTGFPPLNDSYWALRPKRSPALDAIEEVMANMPVWDTLRLPLIVTEQGQQVTGFDKVLKEAAALCESGVLDSVFLPTCLWPDTERQQTNAELLAPLLTGRQDLITSLGEVGFGEQSEAFLNRVLDIWTKVASRPEQAGPLLPSDLSGDWPIILRNFLAVDHQGAHPVLLGNVIPSESTLALGEANITSTLRSLELKGVYPSGWESLGGATLPLMIHDFQWVFLPMALVLLGMLYLVYRSFGAIAATLGMMWLTWIFLIALLSLIEALRGLGPSFAWLPVSEWNFMNLSAIPLLMGTGLDYSIHITLSVRRHGGDLGRVWQHTGKAVLLCGLSTAAGFGSLAFASNRGLSSLGTVCSLGILITTALALIVLPRVLVGGWRRQQPSPTS